MMRALLLALLVCVGAATDTRPNIVLVVIDDLGASDLGVFDNDFYTPTIDGLIGEGVYLERFYTAPTCTPSRAQLMTGVYNFRMGMQDSVIHATEPRGVPLQFDFLSDKLHSSGYTTAGLGKWHLGMHTDEYLPLNRGFDRYYGIYTGGGDHFSHISVSSFTARGQTAIASLSGYNLWEDGQISADNYGGEHSTSLYNKKVLEYISAFTAEEERKPFFMYLAYQAVHDPIDTEAWSVTDTSCHRVHYQDGMDTTIDLENRVKLCGMMAMVDSGIQAIREQLEEVGEWDNTIVFFMSDNGGKMAHGASNYPYRGEKGYYYEGGVRVPAFVSGGYLKNTLDTNGILPYSYEGLVHVTDFHATILSAAGLHVSTSKLDGIDHWNTWTSSPSEPVRSEVVLNFNSDEWGGSLAFIFGDYKLIVNPNPMEAKIYTQVRDSLALDGFKSPDEVLALLETTAKSVLGDSEYLLFNIVENPSENDDTTCAIPAQCMNLWDLVAFHSIKATMLDRITKLKEVMTPSTFAWADDGALANPDNFGGVWAPWRDADGAPLASYIGMIDLIIDQKLYDYIIYNIPATTTTTSQQMNTLSSLDVSSSVSEIAAFTLAATVLVVATAMITYRVARRDGYHELGY